MLSNNEASVEDRKPASTNDSPPAAAADMRRFTESETTTLSRNVSGEVNPSFSSPLSLSTDEPKPKRAKLSHVQDSLTGLEAAARPFYVVSQLGSQVSNQSKFAASMQPQGLSTSFTYLMMRA